MKKIILLSTFAAIALVGCNNSPQHHGEQVNSNDTVATQQFKDEHTAQNSLDWIGTYEGTLPCADCEGIKTTIVLNEDYTFSSREEYLKSPNLLVEVNGNFVWDNSGFKVSLKDNKDYSRSFKVVENAILHLDTEGNEISGALSEQYRLIKK